MEHHLKEAGTTHDSYLKATPDFLRPLQQMNVNQKLPANAVLVVIDVVGLYTNIPQAEGVTCVEKALEKK